MARASIIMRNSSNSSSSSCCSNNSDDQGMVEGKRALARSTQMSCENMQEEVEALTNTSMNWRVVVMDAIRDDDGVRLIQALKGNGGRDENGALRISAPGLWKF